ncbi:MAG: response regulator [Methanoregula sp.]|uniref:hybrid sensor histidine kinase/response regulator n=1 Tax=Methanoregula sp. TaxID=2052170 RepID=UPI0025D89482|nr:response regulator [Methanoregula sp.]MCK9632618.1 response regulator [Methanoregula sp.]
MEKPSKRLIKILVVEDSRTQAEYLRHILETEGYRVILAENGNEAIEQTAVDRPSIILSDIIMPEMDGYEFCHRIKQDPETATIPVILVSQLFDPVDVIRGLESGADDFIIKPYDPESIRSRISTILESIPLSKPESPASPMEISVSDKMYHITAGRMRILRILLSTYEVAVRKNAELEEAREQLNSVNEQLQQAVTDLRQSNTSLESENNERRRVEKALDEANKKLNLMASITRHDVINQLTSQHESLENALSLQSKEPEKAWEHVTSAAAIATRTLNSVKFTGDYQKVGVKSPQWQDVHTLIQAAAKDVLPASIKLCNDISPGTELYADPLIGKVFSNLVENTVKYGEKATNIRFSLHPGATGTVIVCEDDGVGIPDGKKAKIFSYEHGMSNGLGLFLAREILAITAITLRETGTAGSGARFEIHCPENTLRNVKGNAV